MSFLNLKNTKYTPIWKVEGYGRELERGKMMWKRVGASKRENFFFVFSKTLLRCSRCSEQCTTLGLVLLWIGKASLASSGNIGLFIGLDWHSKRDGR